MKLIMVQPGFYVMSNLVEDVTLRNDILSIGVKGRSYVVDRTGVRPTTYDLIQLTKEIDEANNGALK